MSETFGIADLAREFDVTTRTIRFYEDKGLLAPLRKGQRRVYMPRMISLRRTRSRGA